MYAAESIQLQLKFRAAGGISQTERGDNTIVFWFQLISYLHAIDHEHQSISLPSRKPTRLSIEEERKKNYITSVGLIFFFFESVNYSIVAIEIESR